MVKIFRIEGKILKSKREPIFFRREYKALKPEHALEQVYSEFGGLYKVKRSRIKILKIEEISPEEVTSNLVRALL
ncbi:50S ribosomal protein L18Ae [Methanocaldococcus sp.]